MVGVAAALVEDDELEYDEDAENTEDADPMDDTETESANGGS